MIPATRLAELLRRDYLLSCLEEAGVDNWIGYDYALDEKPDEEHTYSDIEDMENSEIIENYGLKIIDYS